MTEYLSNEDIDAIVDVLHSRAVRLSDIPEYLRLRLQRLADQAKLAPAPLPGGDTVTASSSAGRGQG